MPLRGSITGLTYYGEVKYTFTPRFFLAARAERNKYPFIRPRPTVGGTCGSPPHRFRRRRVRRWLSGLDERRCSKSSVRGDRWWVKPGGGFRGQGGYAFAVQMSQAFDVMDWFDKYR